MIDAAACDCVARALWRDPAYQSLDPELAARTYLHARTVPAELRPALSLMRHLQARL